MRTLIHAAVAAILLGPFAAGFASADLSKLQFKGGEVSTPAANGDVLLNISKVMKCSGSTCTGTIKGRVKKQTLISHVSCASQTNSGEISLGWIYGSTFTDIFALLPVMSRTKHPIAEVTSRSTVSPAIAQAEIAVVGGPVQVVIGPGESVFIAIQTGFGGEIGAAYCTLTGKKFDS